MLRIAFILLCCFAPSIAFGDTTPTPHDPVSVMLGVGYTQIGDTGFGVPNSDSTVQSSTGVAFDALVVARVTSRIGIGLRFATASSTSYQEVWSCDNVTDGCTYINYNAQPMDVAVTAQYVDGRLWVAPWIGEHFTIGSSQLTSGGPATSFQTADFVMLGITAGIDLVDIDHNKLGVYVDYHHGIDRAPNYDAVDPHFTNWSAVTVGLAFRR